ncbi:hypothetical protein NDK43_25265 [Neobacillus pocheonensis]|uniref:Uncharacterized protein n=1 Tax=Neobacillus pocheonensis TaxID=363869 RepID=A0ABT0WHR9_9BACI|nr:hypothetical protein [Neobacillus pocheonensis]
MALQQTHDNFGPQSAEIIENILQEVERKSPGTPSGITCSFFNCSMAKG